MNIFKKNIVVGILMSLFSLEIVAENRFIAILNDGYKLEYTLPDGVEPTIPLKVQDKDGKGFTKYTWADIKSVELKDKSTKSMGFTRWEVCKISTPSLILGIKHTEKRLIGVIRDSKGLGKVYKWEIKAPHTGKTEIWYGVLPEGASVVYPFIQNEKVWFRDMGISLGKSNRDFVKSIQSYYVECGAKQAEERQARLKNKPTEILDCVQ